MMNSLLCYLELIWILIFLTYLTLSICLLSRSWRRVISLELSWQSMTILSLSYKYSHLLRIQSNLLLKIKSNHLLKIQYKIEYKIQYKIECKIKYKTKCKIQYKTKCKQKRTPLLKAIMLITRKQCTVFSNTKVKRNWPCKCSWSSGKWPGYSWTMKLPKQGNWLSANLEKALNPIDHLFHWTMKKRLYSNLQ